MRVISSCTLSVPSYISVNITLISDSATLKWGRRKTVRLLVSTESVRNPLRSVLHNRRYQGPVNCGENTARLNHKGTYLC